jgi:sugar lactone lactonase YvrE
MVTIEQVPVGRARLGECPVWSVAEQVLYWIDIDGKAVHRYDPARATATTRTTPGRPGALALGKIPGTILLAMEHQVGWFSWDTAAFASWLDLEAAGTGNRMNDGRCDRQGRLWVGSMHERPAENRFTGMLHRVDPDGTATVHRHEVGIANSLAFSPDGTTMYWADTLRDTVWAHDYDGDSGSPQVPRPFVDFAELPGRPDGACVDEAACLWVACVGGGALARFTPDGALDRLIELPIDKPTMPAFGGRRLDTLFVTSIGDAEPASASATEERGGSLLALSLGIGGVPEPEFGGRP